MVFKYFNNQIKHKDNEFQFGKRTNQTPEYMKSKKEIAQYSNTGFKPRNVFSTQEVLITPNNQKATTANGPEISNN